VRWYAVLLKRSFLNKLINAQFFSSVNCLINFTRYICKNSIARGSHPKCCTMWRNQIRKRLIGMSSTRWSFFHTGLGLGRRVLAVPICCAALLPTRKSCRPVCCCVKTGRNTCVFCACVVFLCTDLLFSCSICVFSVWASLTEIKRCN